MIISEEPRQAGKQTVTLDWVRKAMAVPSARYDAEADRDQRSAVCLRDVAYRIYAQMLLRPHAGAGVAKYRDQLRRRIGRGACYSQPFLGTREFSASFGAASAGCDRDHAHCVLARRP